MKTAAVLGLLLLGPAAVGQNPGAPEPAKVKTAPAVAKSAPPANSQEQAAKPAAKVPPEKEAAIRKLFEIQGTRKSMEQVFPR